MCLRDRDTAEINRYLSMPEVQAEMPKDLRLKWGVSPYEYDPKAQTLSLIHISVWMFGRILEQVWGPKRFLFYYLVCGLGAGIIQEVVQYIHYETVLSAYESVNTGMAIIPMEEYLNMMTTVGASGAVSVSYTHLLRLSSPTG